MSAAEATPPEQVGRARRFFAIVLIFVLIGPPIGGLTFAAGLVLLDMPHFEVWSRIVRTVLNETALVFLLTYAVGGIPALVVGLLAALAVARYGTLSWRAALVVGIVPFVAYRAYGVLGGLAVNDFMLGGAIAPAMVFSTLLCSVVLAPTLICSAIARSLFGLAPMRTAEVT